MKSSDLKIPIFILLLFTSCSDRSLFTDPNDPGMGGVFTILSGEMSGTLQKNKSPYYVANNISVPAGATLAIEGGAQLFFKVGTGLYINGGIRAIGTKELPVVFRAFRDGWDGIHSINPTDSLVFIFCRIQDVYLPIGSAIKYGAIEVVNANLVVKNCYFTNNYTESGGGLALFNCSSEILNNVFYRNQTLVYGGAIFSQNSTNKIINNTIYKNACYNLGGGVVLIDPVSEEIQNNIFFDNFSYLGDPRIQLVSGDTSNVFEQYNFLAFGEMNPLFRSPADFHLQEISPCKDAGNPAPEFNDWDSSRNDQGAYGGPDGDW
jgi:hypothetical protein